MNKDIKYLDSGGLLKVLESVGLKFEDVEKQIVTAQNKCQVRNYATKEELFADIEKGVKFFVHDKVVVKGYEYTFYQDCEEVGTQTNLFTALPVYPSMGGFTRVEILNDDDEWVQFIVACYEKAEGGNTEEYLLRTVNIPRAVVTFPWDDSYYLHGYLTPPWMVPDANKCGCLVFYWDIDIDEEAAKVIYVNPLTKKIMHMTSWEGTSPNLFKFYKEYTSKVAALVPTSARVQVTGTSTTNIMSQKAVTDELNKKADITWVNEKLQGFTPGEGTGSQSPVIHAHTGSIDFDNSVKLGSSTAFQTSIDFDQEASYSDMGMDTVIRVDATEALIENLLGLMFDDALTGPEELTIDCRFLCNATLEGEFEGPCKLFEGRANIMNTFIELFFIVVDAGSAPAALGFVIYDMGETGGSDLEGRFGYYNARITDLENFVNDLHYVFDYSLESMLDRVFS